MRRSVEVFVFSALFVAWLFSLLSIPAIPERCVVCGQREGHNEAEDLRRLTVIEWACDDIPDLHWTCSHLYDAAIHNPNGGIK